MHPNSLKTWYETVEPKIKDKHKAILDALEVLGPSTSLEVADYLKKPLNAISGRFTELSGNSSKEYGKPLIMQVGSRKNRYNNICTVWDKIPYKQVPAGEQLSLI